MDNGKDTVTRTRRLVQWLKDKIEKRRDEREDHDPWWVTLLLDLGRPAVAVMILTMCAPGEHYLGVMAGWSSGLAWLTPAALTAYAGISAVVATKRPKGAPGRNTAIWGAILSIGLAMTAQPVAHLYEQHQITGYRFALTIAVSVIPAAVFGHLLHMGAATPKSVRVSVSEPDKHADKVSTVLAGVDSGVQSIQDWMTDNNISSAGEMSVSIPVDIEEAEPDGHPDIMSAVLAGRTPGLAMDSPDMSPDAATWTPSDMSEPEVSEPAVIRTEDPDTSVRVSTDTVGVQQMSGSLAADVRDFLDRFPDASDTELSEAMSEAHPDKPWNSIYKARVRYEKKIGKGRTA